MSDLKSDLKFMAFSATTKPDKARAFYENVVGARFVEDSPFALVFDVNGTMLRVQKVEKLTPHAFTQLGFEVTDLSAVVAQWKSRGAEFLIIGFPGQDKDGIWTAPGGARIAWCKDPDGNTISLTEL